MRIYLSSYDAILLCIICFVLCFLFPFCSVARLIADCRARPDAVSEVQGRCCSIMNYRECQPICRCPSFSCCGCVLICTFPTVNLNELFSSDHLHQDPAFAAYLDSLELLYPSRQYRIAMRGPVQFFVRKNLTFIFRFIFAYPFKPRKSAK